MTKLLNEHIRVRILKILQPPKDYMQWGSGIRGPEVGDEGYIVDICGDKKSPSAYTVEGFVNGKEAWIADFEREELDPVDE